MMILNILKTVLSAVGMTLLRSLVTEKVFMELMIIGLEKLIKSPKTGPDMDKALGLVKRELEKREKKG